MKQKGLEAMTNFSISDYQDIIAQHLASQQHHSTPEAAYEHTNGNVQHEQVFFIHLRLILKAMRSRPVK